ncbi:MAG TPA: hypothetical protein VMF69_16225 [Gemmataceae bacterium]|nr:hypothetical protein [Gemmataceae bacterium]
MATTPIGAPQTSTETSEERFRSLEALWRAETAHLSSSSKIIGHPTLREIIRMGKAVVPFMLRDLEQQPRLWVWALPEITGDDPVPVSDRGDIVKMTNAWLCWAKEHGYR